VLKDERARKRLWQPVRGPGGVLADGEIVGTWRARTSGSRLEVNVEPFGRPTPRTRQDIEAEAERVAMVRSSDAADVTFSARRR
jgi:hypothetical protein